MSNFSLSDSPDVPPPRTRNETEDDRERAVARAIRERRRIARRMRAASAQLWLSSRPPRAGGPAAHGVTPADHGVTDDGP